jgi:hypothetical protein
MTLDYSSLVASTIKYNKKGFANNITADFILTAMLGAPNLASEVFGLEKPEGDFAEGIKLIDGGEKIFMPLMYARNTTIEGYSGYDTLNITPTDPFTACEYEWRRIAGSINVDNDRLDKNAGSAQKLFDLMKGMLQNLRISYQESWNDMLIKAKASGSKEPLGLFDLVKDNPATNPASGALGGIDAVANTWWRNQSRTLASGALSSFGTDQTGEGMAALRALLRDCSFGTDKPKVLIAGETAYEKVENTMLNQIRYVSDKEKALAKAGFDALMVKGLPMVMEKRITALRSSQSLSGDAIYAINPKYMKLYGMKHRWFEPSKVKEPVNQDTQVQHLITACQLTTDNRRTSGVLYGIA